MDTPRVCQSATITVEGCVDPALFVGVAIHDGAGNVVGRVAEAKTVTEDDGRTVILCTLGIDNAADRIRDALDRSAQLLREWSNRAAYHRAMRQARATLGPLARAAVKCGRNDPCPCRSGAKFKKCCRRKGATR
jgi:hypothetical protein